MFFANSVQFQVQAETCILVIIRITGSAGFDGRKCVQLMRWKYFFTSGCQFVKSRAVRGGLCIGELCEDLGGIILDCRLLSPLAEQNGIQNFCPGNDRTRRMDAYSEEFWEV